MNRHTVTMVAWAALSAAPAVVGAQATTPPPTTVALGTCDCPVGDPRGELRNLAAFAPLGLLGAMAAAGGVPALFAGAGGKEAPSVLVASGTPATTTPSGQTPPTGDVVVARADGARNPSPDASTTGIAPSLNRGTIPDPVSPDSLRAGLRAPNTGTPLPSVFLLGTGLIAVGCVTVLRTRS